MLYTTRHIKRLHSEWESHTVSFILSLSDEFVNLHRVIERNCHSETDPSGWNSCASQDPNSESKLWHWLIWLIWCKPLWASNPRWGFRFNGGELIWLITDYSRPLLLVLLWWCLTQPLHPCCGHLWASGFWSWGWRSCGVGKLKILQELLLNRIRSKRDGNVMKIVEIVLETDRTPQPKIDLEAGWKHSVAWLRQVVLPRKVSVA